MIIVVDSNIVFSGLLSPEGTISDFLLNSNDRFEYCAPSFLIKELAYHQEKILKYSGHSLEELDFLKRLIFRNINFIDMESISQKSWKIALELTNDIDKFDAPFIALTLELNASLWTGDKKLSKGLTEKGIEWVLTTSDIRLLRDKK